MAVCECGHSEERHDAEENICLANDCNCEEFIAVCDEEGGEIFSEGCSESDFYSEGLSDDSELISEDEETNEDTNDEETD